MTKDYANKVFSTIKESAIYSIKHLLEHYEPSISFFGEDIEPIGTKVEVMVVTMDFYEDYNKNVVYGVNLDPLAEEGVTLVTDDDDIYPIELLTTNECLLILAKMTEIIALNLQNAK